MRERNAGRWRLGTGTLTPGREACTREGPNMLTTSDSDIDLAHALYDPSAAFGTPDEVLARADLSIDQKIEMLCRWAYDAAELAVAEEEGMGGGEDSNVHAVLSALDTITGGFESQRTAPTKHGSLCVHRQRFTALPDAHAVRFAARSVPQGSRARGN